MSAEPPSISTLNDVASPLLPRRHFLSSSLGGLGGVALSWLMSREAARAFWPLGS